MDGKRLEVNELIGTPKSDADNSVLSLSASASIVKQQIRTVMGPQQSKPTTMSATFDERRVHMKEKMKNHNLRLAPLEQVMAVESTEIQSNPLTYFVERIAEIHCPIDALKVNHTPMKETCPHTDRSDGNMSKTMVVGCRRWFARTWIPPGSNKNGCPENWMR